jgi:hypothetical protein
MSKFKAWLARAQKRIISKSFRVRVVPFEGAWKVAFDHESRSVFLAKAETIKCAKDLARVHRLTRIAVCNDEGCVTAVIGVGPF